MISNQIISYDEKNNIQKSVFEDIDLVCEKLSIISDHSEKFGISLPMPSYTNFRDALFHFAQIYESSDVFSTLGNEYALREHMQRCIKDAWVSILSQLSNWIEFFCVKNHDMDENIEKLIKSEFPNFFSIDNWNVTFFSNIKEQLEKRLKYGSIEINYFCLIFCANIIQNEHTEYVIELRNKLHILKNFSHKIRSASSQLIKTYEDDTDFQELIDELQRLYTYMNQTNIYPSVYFALGVM